MKIYSKLRHKYRVIENVEYIAAGRFFIAEFCYSEI